MNQITAFGGCWSFAKPLWAKAIQDPPTAGRRSVRIRPMAVLACAFSRAAVNRHLFTPTFEVLEMKRCIALVTVGIFAAVGLGADQPPA